MAPRASGWNVYEHNQQVIGDNACMKGDMFARCAARGTSVVG